MLTKSDVTTKPLEIAILTMKHIQSSQEKEIVSHQLDRCLRSAASEYARRRDYKESFALCNEIESRFWLVRTLMDVGCEMLESGEEEAALKMIELAWENARAQENGFPEADMLGYLDKISSFGHDKLIRSILKFALARVELMDDGEFRLNCFNTMIPYLAVHWREMAEKVIDYILSLPSGLPDTRDEKLCPPLKILFDCAMEISKNDLSWTHERQVRFNFHLGIDLSGIAPTADDSDADHLKDHSSPFINTTCLVTDVAMYENAGDNPHTQFCLQCLAMDAFNNTFPLDIEFFVSEHDKIRAMKRTIKSGIYLDVCGQFSIIDGMMTLYDPRHEVLTGEQYDLSLHFADSPHGPMIDIGKIIFHAVDAVTEMMEQNKPARAKSVNVRNFMDACSGRISVGVGSASGDHRAEKSAEAAVAQLFPRIMSLKSASSAVVNICGSPNMTISEYAITAKTVQERLLDDACVLIGNSINEDWQDKIQVTVLIGDMAQHDVESHIQ